MVGKKNPILLHAKLDSAEEDVYDEGYGTSPIITSPQIDGIFVFAEPERSLQHVAHSPLEDDWYSLAKEINEVVGQQPSSSDGARRQIGKLDFEVPRHVVRNMPVRYVPPPLKESPTKQSRNCCVFCQKNGEIRSVVSETVSQLYTYSLKSLLLLCVVLG